MLAHSSVFLLGNPRLPSSVRSILSEVRGQFGRAPKPKVPLVFIALLIVLGRYFSKEMNMLVGMQMRVLFAGLLCSLLVPAVASAEALSPRSHAAAMLLLSDSDQAIKLGGKAILWFDSGERELLDVLGEVVWEACSGKRQMDPDTLSWLFNAIGKTKQARFAELANSCLVADINRRTKKYVRQAIEELTEGSGEAFQGGHLDLPGIRAGLIHPRMGKPGQLVERFGKLQKDVPLADIYASLGYPDAVGYATVSASNRAKQRVWLTALELTYNGIGEIHFYAVDGGQDWLLDNAVDSNGLLLSSLDGRFSATTELIARGDTLRLREVADFLVDRKALSNAEFEAIMARVRIPADSSDEQLSDTLGWLERAAIESGNPVYEKKMTMRLIEGGDGLQLRHVGESWLAKDKLDGEVLDAMLARITASQDTKDDRLADGLAYLCRVIQKSGDAKYKDKMDEIGSMAVHHTLRKYADSAARMLPQKKASGGYM